MPRSVGGRGTTIKISFVLPRATAYPRFFFLLFFLPLLPFAANKYPLPAVPTSGRARYIRSLGTNTWRGINIARIEARDEILYTRRSNRLARIVQTRYARIVNPDENTGRNGGRMERTVASFGCSHVNSVSVNTEGVGGGRRELREKQLCTRLLYGGGKKTGGKETAD